MLIAFLSYFNSIMYNRNVISAHISLALTQGAEQSHSRDAAKEETLDNRVGRGAGAHGELGSDEWREGMQSQAKSCATAAGEGRETKGPQGEIGRGRMHGMGRGYRGWTKEGCTG